MNLWTCQDPSCAVSATGAAGAIGLRALGWWVEPGGPYREIVILCPAHRPDFAPMPAHLACDTPGCERCAHIAAGRRESEQWCALIAGTDRPHELCDLDPPPAYDPHLWIGLARLAQLWATGARRGSVRLSPDNTRGTA